MVKKIAKNVLSWADDLDHETINQAELSASLPFVQIPIALMPDAHLGYGATVGSVIATKGAVIPSAVGVDIGCGMIAALTNLTSKSLPDNLDDWHAAISKSVPSGVGKQGSHIEEVGDNFSMDYFHAPINKKIARQQLGTLGSGNHFVELCLDEQDRVWIVLHSGSRGTGKKVADYHIAKAKGLMEEYFIDIPHPDLAYLVETTKEFHLYVKDMLIAQDYAARNRELMINQIQNVIPGLKPFSQVINCHHNYCEQEHHRGSNVWVTRKGAIRARNGDMGVIPGSMATGSYIVKGLQNNASFHSASHGAGRVMSRTQARNTLTTQSLDESMKGISWNKSHNLLDEHKDAYKKIEDVMECQKDLVQIQHKLSTILNYKGE